jgi:hypothetical protein
MSEQIVNNSRQTVYLVGDAREYRSVYGYPKRIYDVHRLQPGARVGESTRIGGIKEERIADENGQIVTTVVYEKNNWRNRGLIRFYASPEALLIACGLTPLYKRGDTTQATEMIAEASQQKPKDTPPIFSLADVQNTQLALPPPPAALPRPSDKIITGLQQALEYLQGDIAVGAVTGRTYSRRSPVTEKAKKAKKAAKKSVAKKAKKRARS